MVEWAAGDKSVDKFNKPKVLTALGLIDWLIRHHCPEDWAYVIAKGFRAAKLLHGN
jgi:hypothetical protein